MPAELDALVKILEIIAVLGSAGVVLFKIGRVTQRLDSMGEQHGKDILGLTEKFDKMAGLLVDVAVQKTEINQLRAEIADLRRGRGFITERA